MGIENDEMRQIAAIGVYPDARLADHPRIFYYMNPIVRAPARERNKESRSAESLVGVFLFFFSLSAYNKELLERNS